MTQAVEVQPAEQSFDPITLEVIRNRLDVIAQEMQAAMIRSAFSIVIKEGWDCAASIFDPDGNMVSQAKSLPVHLGVLNSTVKRILETYPSEGMSEGDAYIFNDPYEGGTHIPDQTIVMPIIAEGRTVALACTMAHQQDFGGMSIGSLPPDATEIFQEGLVLPPCRLVHKGEWNQDLISLILKNVRMPRHTVGDLQAMLAAGEVGKRRYFEMVAEYGADSIQRHIDEIMDRTERQTRAKIEEIPDGTYSFQDWLDNDGVVPDVMHKIVASVTVKGSEMVIDFEGTDPQLKGAANSALSGPYCCSYYVMHCLAGPEIPINSGCYRAITLKVPKGTLLNPNHPAPLNARTMTMCRTVDVVFGSLIQAIPDRLRAASAGMEGVSLSGRRPGDNSAYVYLELFAGGMGARPTADGIDYIECDVTNMMNAPVEAVELEYPIRIHKALLRENGGGAGRWRGGTGIEKEFEITEGECEVTHRGDRFFSQPWGLYGGKPGASWATHVTLKNGKEFDVPARQRFPLTPGDRMYCYTGGGGGYGDPFERDPELVRNDVMDRKITADMALDDYGVVIDPDTGEIEADKTEARRKKARAKRGDVTWTYDLGGEFGVA